MDSVAVGEADRASSLAFCRDTITRIADKGLLQRAHIETLLSERVRFLFRLNPKNFVTTKFSKIPKSTSNLFYFWLQDFCQHFFKLFDHKATGALIQDEWIVLLKENTR